MSPVYRTPEYNIWCLMNRRCYDPNDEAFPRYGGRGISVCTQWRHSFATFIADMGRRPSPEHTLDRKKNDKNYSPENCRWATRTEQNENRPGYNRIIIADGKAQCVSAWARELAIPYKTIHTRLERGWSPLEALHGRS